MPSFTTLKIVILKNLLDIAFNDSIIYVADSKDTIDETTVISSVCKIVNDFKGNADVVWRSIVCLHLAASSKRKCCNFDIMF